MNKKEMLSNRVIPAASMLSLTLPTPDKAKYFPSQKRLELVSKFEENIYEIPIGSKDPFNIVFYSHDTMGLGHMRRNLAIAKSFLQSPFPVNVLMIVGTNCATAFSMPQGSDTLILPSLSKGKDGNYKSGSINMTCKQITGLRAAIIRSTIEAFEPDLFIADGVPRGASGELDSSLNFLHGQGKTRCVLGLRDILDDPDVIRSEWTHRGNMECINKYYDSVWIYGDPRFYDSAAQYNFFSDLQREVQFTGFLDRSLPDAERDPESYQKLLSDLNLPPGNLVLCMSGGGEDGGNLLETFSKAELPPESNGVLIMGPLMSEQLKRKIDLNIKNNPRFRLLRFHPEPTRLIKHADRVIAMGGYNTVSEILSFGKRALIVPRVFPRTEQLIRAVRMKKLGLGDYCHPNELTPQAISQWLQEEVAEPSKALKDIDFNGLSRLPLLLEKERAAVQVLRDRVPTGGSNGDK